MMLSDLGLNWASSSLLHRRNPSAWESQFFVLVGFSLWRALRLID